MLDLERIGENWRAAGWLPDKAGLLAGISGGVDSMVLLDLLHRLQPQFGWRVVVAHFNHQLRGRSSDADERFVREAAARVGFAFVAGRGDVRAWSKGKKISVETAARELRHRFFAREARRRRASRILLAHQADDQAELFLLRLLRGAGPAGLAGMGETGPSPADARLQIVRPLLSWPRSGIEAYAARHRLRFREDATNASLDPMRNRIRHRLLPELEREFQPRLREVLVRSANLLREEHRVIAALAEVWKPGEAGAPLAGLPVAVQREVLVNQLQAAGLPVDYDSVEALRVGEIRSIAGKSWNQINGILGRHRDRPTVFLKQRFSVKLENRGNLRLPEGKVEWRVRSGTPSRAGKAHTEYFDADRVGGKVCLRHWQPGDRFHPIGMPRPVKLQDWFTNLKVGAAERRRRWVACDASDAIFWVEGCRISELHKLTVSTGRILEWRWKRGGVGVTLEAGRLREQA